MQKSEKHLSHPPVQGGSGLPDGAGVVIGVGLGALIWAGLALLVF